MPKDQSIRRPGGSGHKGAERAVKMRLASLAEVLFMEVRGMRDAADNKGEDKS